MKFINMNMIINLNIRTRTPVVHDFTGRDLMFKNDGWAQWDPDPERAFQEHDPTLEPYASMSRGEILDALKEARGGREWEFLREFLLDRLTPEELEYERFRALLTDSGGFEGEELAYVCDLAGKATRLITPSGNGPGSPPESP
jgi:hypothetical protein